MQLKHSTAKVCMASIMIAGRKLSCYVMSMALHVLKVCATDETECHQDHHDLSDKTH